MAGIWPDPLQGRQATHLVVTTVLEASHPRNRGLYARHGYHELEPFALPDGTLFWPMQRPPDEPAEQ